MELYIKGYFIQELPNRFLCLVRVKEEVCECYVASSARLGNFIEASNREVLLKPTKPGGRTKFVLVAIKTKTSYELLNLPMVNRLLHQKLEKTYDRDKLQCEKKINDKCKVDLFVDANPPIIYEAKTVLSRDKTVVFPSIKGERSIRQLKEFERCLAIGWKVRYCIFVLSENVNKIELNPEYKDFSDAFLACSEAGMETEVFRVKWDGEKFYARKYSKLKQSLNNM